MKEMAATALCRRVSTALSMCFIEQHKYHSPILLLGRWRNGNSGGTNPHRLHQHFVTDLLAMGPN